MMDRSMAIRLWEDKVGDSGKAPTSVELHLFASTVEKAVREQITREIGRAMEPVDRYVAVRIARGESR